ncbi:hypothetical protein MFLAVUS_007085 [Mucor flavus]|uniref:protein disulfide-isomerase n=1 Tax=Mucor flavus TaxID=439312 RepID=A0ABP9Z3A8_9FUNG
MKTPILGALLTICANLALTQAFYTEKDDVVQLDPQNFGSALLDTDQLVAVEFYASWCGHCQKLAPEWKKAASNLKGLVSVAAVDCDVEMNKPLCAMYEIKGFPTIKVFSPELKPNKKTGKLTKVPTDYQGPRDAKNIVDYLLSSQPSNVRFVKWNQGDVKSKKSISLEDFLGLENETLPKALLFTNKPSTTPLYKALSVDFKDRMAVGEVKHSEKNIVAEYGVNSFPTLLVITPDQGVVKFEGKLNRDSLKKFMEEYALPPIDKDAKYKKTAQKSEPKKSVEKKVQAIENDKIMQEHCLNAPSNTICVIAIIGEDDKQETLDTLQILKDTEKKSDALDFQYGWIHADQANDITNALQLSQDYPSIFIIHPSKQLFNNYVGSWSEKNLQQWLGQVASGRINAWTYKDDLKISEKPDYVDEPIVDEEEYEEELVDEQPARDEL